jgi:hypothetical protein
MPGVSAMRNCCSEAEAPNVAKRFIKPDNEGGYDKASKENSNEPHRPVRANTLPTF